MCMYEMESAAVPPAVGQMQQQSLRANRKIGAIWPKLSCTLSPSRKIMNGLALPVSTPSGTNTSSCLLYASGLVISGVLALHARHHATAQGYDPSANGSAEAAVGLMKTRIRYLLTGARLPAKWWDMTALAAAQCHRVDAGYAGPPKVPFGTRVMANQGPAPRPILAVHMREDGSYGPPAAAAHTV